MILITGAAGKTGQAVMRALRKRKTPIRALVHSDHKIQPVQSFGAQDVVVGDMGSQKSMHQAFQDVEAVYHICPNVSPDEIKIGRIVIQAAQSAGVEHIVYHSVFHSQIESMPHHWQKMRVEERLFKSGLAYTILQPAPYMQNILAYWPDIVKKGRYQMPFSKNTRLGTVDLEDVAEAAAIVLTESGHKGAIYELCGAENLSQSEIAQILGQTFGHSIKFERLPLEAWEANARSQGLGDYQVNALISMFRYYEQFGYFGNSRVLACLLDRAPTSYAAFVERTISSYANR